MNLIAFDLEGPLSPQDNAYEVMNLIPRGRKIFEVISHYDDLLTLEGREGYEPGDTLALIVPFLIAHDVAESDIEEISQKAGLVAGSPELVAYLKEGDWQVYCISTSYHQHALRITQRVGIDPQHVACTFFPLDKYRSEIKKADRVLVEREEQEIINLKPKDDQAIKEMLDRFFWRELPPTRLGAIMKEVKPIGGRRKVAALRVFAAQHNMALNNCIFVGDSITDSYLLKTVDEAGGLAIAFNGNEYALPRATVGLASTSLADLRLITEAWEKGGIKEVKQAVKETQGIEGKRDRGHFHWLKGENDLEESLAIHERIRRLVREGAAKLG
ncbi:MAG: hypothetical protein HY664_06020 [Chloroflexi bacterium]|nr:hypothetical protein [Chloroflexota bacterium]